MRTRAYLSAAVVCAVTILMATGCSSQKPETATRSLPEPIVQTVVLSRGTLEKSINVSGTLGPLPNREVIVTPQVSGTLILLNATLGSNVAKRQVIAEISPELPGSQVLQAEAELEQSKIQEQEAESNAAQQLEQTQSAILTAKANVGIAQATLLADTAALAGDSAAVQSAAANLRRQTTLFNEGLVAQKDVDEAKLENAASKSVYDAQLQTIESQRQAVTAQIQQFNAAKSGRIADLVKRKDIEIAQQQVANAKAALASSQIQASLYTIKAPISGKVTSIGANVGESIDPTSKLITISDLSQMQATLNIPGNLISEVAPGNLITVTSDQLPAGQSIGSHIESISTNFDPNTGTVSALARLDNSKGLLRDDMTVSARTIVGRHNAALVVPEPAILTDPDTGNKSIAVVDSQGILRIKNVTVGLTGDRGVEITSGAFIGNQVVISGAYGLTDGTSVIIANSTGQTKRNGP